jgi:hypothetical protein
MHKRMEHINISYNMSYQILEGSAPLQTFRPVMAYTGILVSTTITYTIPLPDTFNI